MPVWSNDILMNNPTYESPHGNRQVFDLSHVSDKIDHFYQSVCENGTKKAEGAGVRVGGSADRNNISQYRYINTKKMLLLPRLLSIVEDITSSVNIDDHVLTHNVLHLPPQGFLDWQDYYMWKKKSIRSNSFQVIGPVIRFFSISLTDNNNVEFKEEVVDVKIHHAISFAPGDVHQVSSSEHDRMWLVLGVADHVDLCSTLN